MPGARCTHPFTMDAMVVLPGRFREAVRRV